ncbi:MAG: 1-acyl-sn-glycerol-3-phosphate acyltransferase [Acidobacteriia bacterium]|nr:1-acyl-sn-glycerol-3-phosphate acyltransferase [Terriglobia bacterium]
MIRAFFVISLTFVYLLLLGPPLFLFAYLTGNANLVYRVGAWGCRFAVWLAGVRLEVQGREKIPTGQAVVFMPNHQSNCDPPAVISILPRVRVLVKKEFCRTPLLGRAMLLVGFIPVDRKNRERAIEAIEEGAKSLAAGHSFMVFPEGTRSRDGRLQPFKKGAFVMAMKAQVPIIPISLSGSSRIMQKGRFAIRPGLVRITVHDAVPTAGYVPANRSQLMERVRRAVLSGLAENEQPLSTASSPPVVPPAPG